MAESAVSRNYAEALFDLATKSGQLEQYGRLLDAIAAALASTPQAQSVLVSPKVSKAAKGELIGRAAAAVGAPREFVLFLQAVVKRGRQGMLAEIAQSYANLVDAQLNRIRAQVTVARQPDQQLAEQIAASLSKTVGKQVLVQFAVEPEILGGTIVRMGSRVYDGSLRRRLVRLRGHLLGR